MVTGGGGGGGGVTFFLEVIQFLGGRIHLKISILKTLMTKFYHAYSKTH